MENSRRRVGGSGREGGVEGRRGREDGREGEGGGSGNEGLMNEVREERRRKGRGEDEGEAHCRLHFVCTMHLPPQHHVEYTTNIDITSYESGKRQTHNPTGRALASGVWEFYKVIIMLLTAQSGCIDVTISRDERYFS